MIEYTPNFICIATSIFTIHIIFYFFERVLSLSVLIIQEKPSFFTLLDQLYILITSINKLYLAAIAPPLQMQQA